MKKMTKILPVIAAVALMAACGGGKKNYENLISQKWVLEKVEIADSTSQIDVPANLTLEFSDSNRVSGRGPCNGFFGPYTIENNKLEFSNFASTMMYCMQMPFEDAYHSWLKEIKEYNATQNSLQLKNADGKIKLYYTVFDPTALEASDFSEAITGETMTADADAETGETQVAE